MSVYSMHFCVKKHLRTSFNFAVSHHLLTTQKERLPRLITKTPSEKNLAACTMLCNGLLGGGLTNNFCKGNYKRKADCSFPVWKVSREIPESWKIHWDCFSGCVSALHLVQRATAGRVCRWV